MRGEAFYVPLCSLLGVHDEPERELRAARAELRNERVQEVQDDPASPAGVDDFPDHLKPIAVMNDLDVTEMSERGTSASPR